MGERKANSNLEEDVYGAMNADSASSCSDVLRHEKCDNDGGSGCM